MRVTGRLRPGSSAAAAEAEVHRACSGRPVQFQPGGTGYSMLRVRLYRPLLLVAMVVALVLLIACANLANLMLAATMSRGREIAVRAAIGASRGRIVRQLMTESMLLSAIGTALGLVAARWTSGALLAFLPPDQATALPNLRFELDATRARLRGIPVVSDVPAVWPRTGAAGQRECRVVRSEDRRRHRPAHSELADARLARRSGGHVHGAVDRGERVPAHARRICAARTPAIGRPAFWWLTSAFPRDYPGEPARPADRGASRARRRTAGRRDRRVQPCRTVVGRRHRMADRFPGRDHSRRPISRRSSSSAFRRAFSRHGNASGGRPRLHGGRR